MKKIYVGLSGGVDSSLSAALLKEQGYDVVGVYMKNWSQDLPGAKCPWAEDLADAKRVAVQLDIPFKVFDFEKEYKHLVVDYMVSEYKAGRTPNPDVMCNQEVKFGLFLQAALEVGADGIATGHYARVGKIIPKSVSSSGCLENKKNLQTTFPDKLVSSKRSEPDDIPMPVQRTGGDLVIRSAPLANKSKDEYQEKCLADFFLLRAKDENKDQTYFLYRITESALAKTLFPVGDLTKQEVRREAEKRGLVTAKRRESQGICFVGNVGIREFLGQYIEAKPGNIIEKETGKVLGQHDGAIYYTFGQRHNLGVGGGMPYYVVGKNMKKNEVYVSTNLNDKGFWRQEIEIDSCHFINEPPKKNKTYQVRLRHRGKLLDTIVVAKNNGKYLLILDQPERAIAPGQSAVIYDGEVVLGGGFVLPSPRN